MTDFGPSFDAWPNPDPSEVLGFFLEWLLEHIAEEDRALAVHLRATGGHLPSAELEEHSA